MAILHGSWICKPSESYFFLWGETWRLAAPTRTEAPVEVATHPAAMSGPKLQDYVRSRSFWPAELTTDLLICREIFALPSRGDRPSARRRSRSDSSELLPVLSGDEQDISDIGKLPLHWWQVEGVKLPAAEAAIFLRHLPLNSFQVRKASLGDALRFWSHLYRWSLDLLARGKVLPGVLDQTAGWYPLLDSAVDQARLTMFAKAMPGLCRAYATEQTLWAKPKRKDPWIDAQTVVLNFLSYVVDAQIRPWVSFAPSGQRESLAQPWLHALAQPEQAKVETTPEALRRLDTVLTTWRSPVQDAIATPATEKLNQNQFRLCLDLIPPTPGEMAWGQTDWKLNYTLCSIHAVDCAIDAETIWKNPVDQLTVQDQVLEDPQETLLRGLGLAAKVYDPIRASLTDAKPVRCLLNPIEAYELVRARVQQLQDMGVTVLLPPGLAPGAGEKRLGIKITAKVRSKRGERLGLKTALIYSLELAIGEQTVSPEEFEQLLDQRSPLVEVNGEWLALQPADVRAAQAILSVDSDTNLDLTVEDALRFSTGEAQLLAKLPVVSFTATGKLKELIAALVDNTAIASLPQPEQFNGTLRPYQIRGMSWLAFLEQWSLGACLADDMGLGKTLQLIAFVLHLKETEALNQPTLVVCPTSVLSNWEREIQKFAPTLSTWVHHGEKRQKGKPFVLTVQKKDLVLTSYSLVYRDVKTLEQVKWSGVVLDEAQNVKNAQAKQSQAVRHLKAGFRIALTGTPVENRLTELWSILDFLNPNFLGDQQFFQKRFATPIEKYGDRNSLQILRSLVRPFILRRLKTDKTIIQDLPEKQEMTVYCGLSAEQAQLYQTLVDTSLENIEAAKGIQRHGLILTLLTRLKQVCNHPSQYLGEKGLITGMRSGKLLRLHAMLEEVVAEGDRALIFTQFAEWGKLLQAYLSRHLDTEVLFLYGSTPRAQRQEMIDRFQSDTNGPQIFLLSLKAGGTGLNLTRANHVFHVDRWWNPAVENQATDRAFRIGQQRNVQVHKFVCTGTLEERINDIIESKKQLAEQTVDAGEQWLTTLDTDQLRTLLMLDSQAIMDAEEG
ncbi:DEAD/DEAH box helicase [Spirulina major]|uniref:DEAD/DEAH box helicase n=1 Tax=Spirulina major TaxID=270636 RepID=UPI000933C7AE|nr:DEAD/DEAH box helicase [Spirulina major]